MSNRVINFSPGPATLPFSALEHAQKEFLDFEGTGMSILEHSHRGKDYARVHQETKDLLKELLSIPDSHEVLFMQGGATGQFALVPMNFLKPQMSADYVMTGAWSKKALAEAKIAGNARKASDQEEDGKFRRVPHQSELELDPKAAYLHFTSNNTIFGTQFHTFPDSGSVPLVSDMSSDILWRPIDVSKFGLIYAGAQKNLGPAGITIVIIRKSWVEEARTDIPKIFRYKTILDGDSLQNTVPTFPIYIVRNVLRWVKEQGGAQAMEAQNKKKSQLLYNAIDKSNGYFNCPVEKDSRSVMNVVFRLPSEELEKKFVTSAAEHEMVNTKGHRSVGGIRISMYNAMPLSSIEKLVHFMEDFQKKNPS